MKGTLHTEYIQSLMHSMQEGKSRIQLFLHCNPILIYKEIQKSSLWMLGQAQQRQASAEKQGVGRKKKKEGEACFKHTLYEGRCNKGENFYSEASKHDIIVQWYKVTITYNI